ncbi:unnamed protein product [Lampetra planeri]
MTFTVRRHSRDDVALLERLVEAASHSDDADGCCRMQQLGKTDVSSLDDAARSDRLLRWWWGGRRHAGVFSGALSTHRAERFPEFGSRHRLRSKWRGPAQFDKMADSERNSIHEVMEQQTISIAHGALWRGQRLNGSGGVASRSHDYIWLAIALMECRCSA